MSFKNVWVLSNSRTIWYISISDAYITAAKHKNTRWLLSSPITDYGELRWVKSSSQLLQFLAVYKIHTIHKTSSIVMSKKFSINLNSYIYCFVSHFPLILACWWLKWLFFFQDGASGYMEYPLYNYFKTSLVKKRRTIISIRCSIWGWLFTRL